MKNFKKFVLIISSLMILLTGCSQGSNSDNNIETQDNSISDESKLETDSNSTDNIESSVDNNSESNKETASESAVVSESEIDEMINSNKKAFVAVGDFDSENYELLRDNLTKACEERNEDMYVLNTKDENNSEWLSENEITAETNVAILYNGNLYVLDLKYEEEYQSEVLGSMLDGIISQVSGTN